MRMRDDLSFLSKSVALSIIFGNRGNLPDIHKWPYPLSIMCCLLPIFGSKKTAKGFIYSVIRQFKSLNIH